MTGAPSKPKRKLESVKLNPEIVSKYRELSGETLIPISRMIERAMEDSVPTWRAVAKSLRKDRRSLELVDFVRKSAG